MDLELDCPYMNETKKIVSIIPARAGSKRIPGKNKFLFKGQALVEWSLKFSLKCNKINETILSTDDLDIIKLANKCKISLHKRSKNMSGDKASTFDLIKSIYYDYLDEKVDIIFLLQPTSPLREKYLIDNALKLINQNSNWSSLIEVYKSKLFTGKIKNNYWYPDLLEKTRSQEIPASYVPSGRLYAYNCIKTIRLNDAYGKKVIPMITDEWKNVNIDESSDLEKMRYVYDNHSKDYSYLLG